MSLVVLHQSVKNFNSNWPTFRRPKQLLVLQNIVKVAHKLFVSVIYSTIALFNYIFHAINIANIFFGDLWSRILKKKSIQGFKIINLNFLQSRPQEIFDFNVYSKAFSILTSLFEIYWKRKTIRFLNRYSLKVSSQQLRDTLATVFWRAPYGWRFYGHGSRYVLILSPRLY